MRAVSWTVGKLLLRQFSQDEQLLGLTPEHSAYAVAYWLLIMLSLALDCLEVVPVCWLMVNAVSHNRQVQTGPLSSRHLQ